MLTKARATQLMWVCLKEGICEENMKVERRGFYGRSASEASITLHFLAYRVLSLLFLKKKVQWAGGRNLNMFISKDPITHLWAWHIPAPCLPILLENVHMWEPTAQLLWPLLRHFLQANMLKLKYVHFNKSTFHQLQGRISVYTGSISWFTYFLLP